MKRIDKAATREALKAWSNERTVIAPHVRDHGERIFDVFDEASFTLDYRKPSMPPKSVFFPQSEIIFRIEDGTYRTTLSRNKTLLFGLRPCDMKALLQSRNFMSKDFTDAYYEARARNTATVVMACPGSQSPTCFCTTTGSGPFADGGYDLQFVEDGDSFLVDAATPLGMELASLKWFREADDGESQSRLLLLKDRAERSIPILDDVKEAVERLRGSEIPDGVWEGFGDKCIVCGGCSFVCPTCTCFTVSDSVHAQGNGERLRSWDACLYAGFTKEASGHNPRGTQALRLKRRHEHKLRYFMDRQTYGSLCTCVGCGRCSDFCPVHIGTIEVAKAVCGRQTDALPEGRRSGGMQ